MDRAKAAPILSPVKDPGPVEQATQSISLRLNFANLNIDSIKGAKTSE
jgi:hypothetical protein